MARRLQLTLISLVLTVITMVGLVPFVLTVVSIPLFVVWVGIPMFLGSVALTRMWADAGRRVAGVISGRPIVRPYRVVGSSAGRRGPIAWLRGFLTDPATWRDLVWILITCTAGFAMVVLVPAFFLGTAFYLSYPLLLAVTPSGVFNDPFGPLLLLSDWRQGFLVYPVALLSGLIWWFVTPGLLAGWAGITRGLLGPTRATELSGRVASLRDSRAETRDAAAAELRRIERDLHDGVQVRLASLGMNLGLVEQLMATDPARARAILSEASAATTTTMEELRMLVRGIHPPVLADRGLVGAVRALTLDAAVRCSYQVSGFGDPGSDAADRAPVRLEEPVESCVYFGVAEALANVVKHSRAEHAEVDLRLTGEVVTVRISDDGRGGARIGDGSGLPGLERRLRAFDGTLRLDSPPGGPTHLIMELPCASSSPKTTPSFARG